jgi:hypothetical protein
LDGNHVFALHVSRPSTFRAPGWGALASLSPCCRWRNATLRKLVPFSHRSASRIFIRQPGCIPSPVVTQDGDHQFDGGEKRAGLLKGKCALGPFLSILVIECKHKCLNVNICPWMNKVQIMSKGMFLSLSTLVLSTNILV